MQWASSAKLLVHHKTSRLFYSYLGSTDSAHITMQGSLSRRVKYINTWSYGLRRWQKILMILKCFLTFPSRALFPAGACYVLMSF